MDEIKTRVKINQETPTTSVQRSEFGYRYAYARASEYKNAGDIGQDYLVMIENDKRLCFALCDGVSQSFYGDIAACSLGDSLVDWLFNSPNHLNDFELKTNLTSYLQHLTEPVTKKIKEFVLPTNLAPMVQNALDKKRVIGSESTFIAGRIDLDENEIILTWMGDSTLRIWGTESEISSQLGDIFLKQERWSSLKGLVGNVHTFSGSIDLVPHIVAYSDGLKKLDSKMKFGVPSNHAIDIQIEEAGEDDISLFEFWVGKLPHLDIVPPEKPGTPEVLQSGGLMNVSWNQISNASQYEIEFRTEHGELIYRQTTLPTIHFIPSDLPANIKSLRLRIWQGEEPGVWSDTKLLHEAPEKTAIPVVEPVLVLQPIVSTVNNIPTPSSEQPVRPLISDRIISPPLPNQQFSNSPNQLPSIPGSTPKPSLSSPKRRQSFWTIGISILAALILLFGGIFIEMRITKTRSTPTPSTQITKAFDINIHKQTEIATASPSSPFIITTPTNEDDPQSVLPSEIDTLTPEVLP